MVDLLHMEKEAEQVAHRLAHGTHVLLLGVQRPGGDGRVELGQHAPPLPRPNLQL